MEKIPLGNEYKDFCHKRLWANNVSVKNIIMYFIKKV